jgi:hypothetical protein
VKSSGQAGANGKRGVVARRRQPIFVCGGKSWLIVDDSTFEELESE